MSSNLTRSIVWTSLFALAWTLAGAAITGTVIDREGQTIEGAVVTAFAPETRQARVARMLKGEAEPEPLARTVADSRGRFSLDTKGAYSRVRFEAPGHVPTIEWIADGPLGAIALARGKTASVVITGDGKPIEGAIVAYGATVARSDSEGGVSISYSGGSLPPLELFHSDYAPERLDPRPAPKSLRLTAGVAVSGIAVDAAGRPVAGARIEIDGYPLATTDEQGAFAISRAPSSWKQIVAIESDRIAAATRRRQGSYELKLSRGTMITGAVTDSARSPLPGTIVELAPPAERFRRISAHGSEQGSLADARGNFTIGPVLAGSYELRPFRGGHEFAPSPLDVRAGDRVTRTLVGEPMAVVTGSVVDEAKRAVAAAEVTAMSERGGPAAMPSRVAAWSGPDGAFVLRSVATGRNVSVRASKPGYPESDPEGLELRSGERKDGLSLMIPRGVEIAGTVMDREGTPIANARVVAAESRGAVPGMVVMRRMVAGGEAEQGVTTDAKGKFALRAKRGRHDLTASAPGYAPGLIRGIEAAEGSDPLEIRLEEGVEIAGRVVRADRTGVADVNIVLIGEGVGDGRAVTDPDGRFTLADLRSGSVNLIASKPDEYIREMRTVEAPARDVLIELGPGGGLRGRVIEKGTKAPVTDFRAGPSERRGRLIVMGPSSLRPFRADDGTFELTNLPVGPTEILVEAPGFVRATVPVEIKEGEVLEGVEITLDPGAKITGRVAGPDGSPLSGASVAVRAREQQRMPMPPGMSGGGATTDANGEFTLEGVAEGEQTIAAEREGYVPDTKNVDVAGREMRVDFRLGRGVDVTGMVVTDSGAPVPLASVSARTSAMGGEMERTRADANGGFRFTGLAPGRYTFSASHDDYSSGDVKDVDVATTGPIRITLSAGGTISGRVLGLKDDEIASAMVMATAGSTTGTSTVAPDGSFRVTGAPTGTVRVTAQVRSIVAGWRTSPPETVEVAPGTESHVDIEMGSGHSVTGRVIRGGRPVEGASVMFAPRDPRVATSGAGRADANGRYEVVGLESGVYDVRVFDMNTMSSFSTEYSVTGSGSFDIEIVGRSVRGTVVDASTNEPLAGASVVAEEVSASRSRVGVFPIQTDARGSFSFESMSPGSYRVRVTKDGFGQQVEQLVLDETSDQTLEIRLQPSEGLGLKIVDARDGRPLEGYVSVADAMGRVAWEGPLRATGKEFATIPLAAGGYRALINAAGYAPRIVNVTAPAAGMTVAVSPGGTVRIEPVSPERTLARLLAADGQPWRRSGWNSPAEFVIDASGATLQNVVPGSYTLEVLDAAGGVADRESFTVVEGQTVVVRP